MREHFEKLLELLEMERRAETEQNKLELSRVPVQIRESMGKSVSRLSAELGDAAEGGLALLRLSRDPAGEELAPFHSMNRGDLVCAELPTGQKIDGTLYEADEYSVLMAVRGRVPEPLPNGRWALHLVGSDATYRRMKKALQEVPLAEKKPVAALRDVSFGREPTASHALPEFSFFNEALNEYQRQAVRSALAARHFALIHGPPGTGKTTVLIEVIRQAVRDGARVLASAPSNIAVDNILEKLLGLNVRVVRMGHPARTMEPLRHATLAAQISAHPDSKSIRDLDLARERLIVQRSRRADRGQLGYAERHERQREITELWREARGLEKSLSREILHGAQVVLTTHGSIGSALGREVFDLAVLDEASQAVEPLSWVPLSQAKKAVLAGDPRQLPPTLYSPEAAKAGLETTLFDRLQRVLPKDQQTLLRVQYRMHEAIMNFSSREFYGGRLIADPSVKSHLARDLPGVSSVSLAESPVHFVDTAGAGYEEKWDEALQSRENAEEAALVRKIAGELLDAGFPPSQMAVITPYVAQSRRLKSLGFPSGVEIGTVDGFQGREKEAVFLSLVRSNQEGEVGFLGDARRLNVALTRARRLLVVVGDSSTVGGHPLYGRFLEYVESIGAHRSAWEWIGT